MPIGCASVETHRGQIMIGRRSTSARISSNHRLPDPTTTTPELHDRHPAFPEHIARLDATPEALAECLFPRCETAEIDDSSNSGLQRLRRNCGGEAISFEVVAVRPDGVDEVVGDVDADKAASSDTGSNKSPGSTSVVGDTRGASSAGRRARQRSRTPAPSRTGTSRPPM